MDLKIPVSGFLDQSIGHFPIVPDVQIQGCHLEKSDTDIIVVAVVVFAIAIVISLFQIYRQKHIHPSCSKKPY